MSQKKVVVTQGELHSTFLLQKFFYGKIGFRQLDS